MKKKKKKKKKTKKKKEEEEKNKKKKKKSNFCVRNTEIDRSRLCNRRSKRIILTH